MLDPKYVREHETEVRKALADCHSKVDLSLYLDLERRRRDLMMSVDKRKARLNQASEEMARMKKEGKDITPYQAKLKELSDEIKQMDGEIAAVEKDFREIELQVCNIPHSSVPVGGEEANQEVRKVGEPAKFSFKPKSHDELGVALGILDFEKAAKISGARFFTLSGLGAKLERALANFMLDLHAPKGYKEMVVPHLVNYQSMEMSGQFPKFIEQAFAVEKDNFYLIPTAEVSLANLHRGETFAAGSLPRKYAAFTPCYRREAGSYGKDTKGLIRLHQFNKVELFQFVEPDKSMEALEQLTADAEEILKKLGLPYRVVVLATADKSFASIKTYDLEVWLPSQNQYREISSCSNCGDFQARRGAIKVKKEGGAKPELVHTLNGSGLAVGRTWLAILENYQQADGTVAIPEVLQPYLGGLKTLTPGAA
ncbi:MAG TPA: serine--tRNA ligase [bacterium]|nr:serine--tRNA ligase [bacterium]